MSYKKGFTLVELLGVFVILSIIVLVTFPYATGLLKNTKDSEYERFEKNLFLATEAYIESNSEIYSQFSENGTIDYISISDLIENQFLSKKMTNPKTKTEINENGCIKVTKNNDELNYEYISEGDFGLSQYTTESLLSLYDSYKQPITTNGTSYLKNLSTVSDETMAQLRGFDNGWNKEYLSFDGVDDNVEVGYKNREFPDGITFEIVVKINEIKTTSQEFFGNWEGAGGGLGYNSSGEIYFNLCLVSKKGYVKVKTTISPNAWYTITGTYDGSNMKIYVNGELKDSLSISDTIKASPVSIAIGGNPTADGSDHYRLQFPGNIDMKRAALYSRALTKSEITKNYKLDQKRYGI